MNMRRYRCNSFSSVQNGEKRSNVQTRPQGSEGAKNAAKSIKNGENPFSRQSV